MARQSQWCAGLQAGYICMRKWRADETRTRDLRRDSRRSNQLNYDPAQVCLRERRAEVRFYRIPVAAADDWPLV